MPKQRPTQIGLRRGFGSKYSTLHTQYTGYHSARIVKRGPRSYGTAQERKNQFLIHMATVLKGYYSSLAKRSEIEIQIALTDGGQWFIAANKDSTTEYFYEKLVGGSVARIGLELKRYADATRTAMARSKATERYRLARHARKFRSELKGGRRTLHETRLQAQVKALEMAGYGACYKLNALTARKTDIDLFATGAMSGKSIALVTAPKKDWHAEQKIMYALVRAGTLKDLSITFSGTFRPCRGCYESLTVVRDYYMPHLRFNPYPGHFWNTTNQCHVAIVKELIKQGKLTTTAIGTDFDDDFLLSSGTTTTHRPRIGVGDDILDDLHYASDSDSDWDEEDDWEDDDL